MPLVRAEVRNEFAHGAPELYGEAKKEEPKEILEGVAVAGLVGVLRQLGDLAEFAAEIFHGLQEEVTLTTARSHKLMNRVRRIEAALSPLEKALLAQRSHLHFAYTAGSNWRTRIRCEQNQFIYSDVPHFIMESYEDCRHPPCLHMLDRFDPGGPGSCLKRYSDPTFFKSASLASGEISADKISKEKKKGRKTKKRRSWPKNGETSQDPSFSYNSGRMPFTQRSTGGNVSPSQTASTCDATLRSDFGEQSTLDLRNGSSYIEGDFRPSYSVEQESRDSISSAVKKQDDYLDYSFIAEKSTDLYDDIEVGTNLDLRTGSSNIESDFRPSYSVEPGSRDSISSEVKKHENDYLDYSFTVEKATDAYDDIEVCTQEQTGCSSSSVTWDEKRESFKPALQLSDTDGMAQEDNHNRHLESFPLNLDMVSLGDKGSDFETVGKMVAPFCNETVRELETGDVRLDDIESETDNFMDALNTIETECETDIDSTKKQVVEHNSQLGEKGEDDEARLNLECQSSSPESNILASSPLIDGSHIPHGHNIISMPRKSSYATDLINEASPKGDLNSVSPMNKDLQSSERTGDSVSPGCQKSSDSEGNYNIGSGKYVEYAPPTTVSSDFEDGRPFPVTDGTRESPKSKNHGEFDLKRHNSEFQSSIPEFNVTLNSPVINGSHGDTRILSPKSPNTTDCFTEEVSSEDVNSIYLLNKDLQSSSQKTGDSAGPGCSERSDSYDNGNFDAGIYVESVASSVSSNLGDARIGLFTKGTRKSPESHEQVQEISNITPATFWTNGGLLGLQPSKPPECSVLNVCSQDPESNKDGKTNSSSQHFSLSDKDSGQPNQPETSRRNWEDLGMNMLSDDYRESGTTFRKASWKISPADLEINLGTLGDSVYPKNANTTGSSIAAPRSFALVNAAHQEKSSSSGIFGFSNRLLSTGSNEKSLPGGDGNTLSASYKHANDSELKNRLSVEYRTFSGRRKDLGGKSPLLSPSQSPPLEHMKISFQPINGFESSKLKLKFPDGKTNNGSGSGSDIYPSFQLVPEVSLPRYNVVSDSDADTFYRSSPSLSDDCHSNQSESNSEQWESIESPTSKDHDLYDALHRISLTESASALPETGSANQDHTHGNLGLQFPFVENGVVRNSGSCRSFDLQSLSTINNSFRKKPRNDANPKDRVEPHLLPSTALPPLPPTKDKSETMLGGSYYDALGLAHSDSAISQPKPAPFNEDQIDIPNMQKSKPNSRKSNVQGEVSQGKSPDENDFLHQIRTKSFNLRPTVTTRSTVPSGSPANVQVNAILEKANAIRQAVASDAEDDGNWSDP